MRTGFRHKLSHPKCDNFRRMQLRNISQRKYRVNGQPRLNLRPNNYTQTTNENQFIGLSERHRNKYWPQAAFSRVHSHKPCSSFFTGVHKSKTTLRRTAMIHTIAPSFPRSKYKLDSEQVPSAKSGFGYGTRNLSCRTKAQSYFVAALVVSPTRARAAMKNTAATSSNAATLDKILHPAWIYPSECSRIHVLVSTNVLVVAVADVLSFIVVPTTDNCSQAKNASSQVNWFLWPVLFHKRLKSSINNKKQDLFLLSVLWHKNKSDAFEPVKGVERALSCSDTPNILFLSSHKLSVVCRPVETVGLGLGRFLLPVPSTEYFPVQLILLEYTLFQSGNAKYHTSTCFSNAFTGAH
mgnify:CR=1 FL=1